MPDNIIQNVSIQGEGNIVVGKGDVIINPLLPAETRLRHDLGILLKNVETTWIKGVLEKSVHEAALLESVEKLEQKPDSKARQTVLQEEVVNAKADQDSKLLQAANELLEKLKALPGANIDIKQNINIKGSGNIITGQGDVTVNE